jgi:hypothetical protein
MPLRKPLCATPSHSLNAHGERRQSVVGGRHQGASNWFARDAVDDSSAQATVLRLLRVSGLREWKVRKNGQSNQPEKPRAPRAAEESSGKGRTIPHNTTPSLCIVAEEGKEKQLLGPFSPLLSSTGGSQGLTKAGSMALSRVC